MRYEPEHKTRTRDRIVRNASRKLRAEGLSGSGVASVMKASGLTVGGFYKHFDSRDDLVLEALRSAFGTCRRQSEAAASDGPLLTYAKLVDDYLSEAHRDHPGSGCAVGALAGEIARSSMRTRALLTEEIRNNFQLIADLTPAKDEAEARSRAILTLSALVGAIGLSRAVTDEGLSREILKTVGELLKRETRE